MNEEKTQKIRKQNVMARQQLFFTKKNKKTYLMYVKNKKKKNLKTKKH